MAEKNTSIFFSIFILSIAIFAIGGDPWSSDLLGAVFEKQTKNYILVASGIISAISFILYLSEKNKFKRSIKKIGNEYYSNTVASHIERENINPEVIEKTIQFGSSIKRNDIIKYSWVNPEGSKYLVITNLKGVILEVSC
ncbi:hypothetical protein [Candidatus Endoriftia persephonae]|jgi:hypothetical protein|uniref:Uncharacterized protein n=1 Tax=Candidatus Endoriftia persephonae TaxID=393765 RepID=A0A9J6ZUI4_9GAMM|nr:hypothetical protein [Candidatus Endoriftia persephone]USF86417.1 hypothetical protein L0Y14_09700 [Candidatus Endoriftia persephone]